MGPVQSLAKIFNSEDSKPLTPLIGMIMFAKASRFTSARLDENRFRNETKTQRINTQTETQGCAIFNSDTDDSRSTGIKILGLSR